jgi:hypothetical protein
LGQSQRAFECTLAWSIRLTFFQFQWTWNAMMYCGNFFSDLYALIIFVSNGYFVNSALLASDERGPAVSCWKRKHFPTKTNHNKLTTDLTRCCEQTHSKTKISFISFVVFILSLNGSVFTSSGVNCAQINT